MYRYQNTLYERVYINIDSRQRTIEKYPNSNSFVVNNINEYRNVIYARLLTAETPVTDFNINEYNNKITFVDDGITYNVELPVGDYTTDDLLTQLDLVINGAGASNTYTFTISSGILTITGGGGTLPYQFLFATGPFSDTIQTSSTTGDTQIIHHGDARRVLGFAIADYTSNADDQIIAPYKVDLTGATYLLLELGSKTDKFHKINALDQYSNEKFYKIQLSAPRNTINYLYEDQAENRLIVFPSPISKLKEFEIKYWTYDGYLYNFRGYENSFTLELGVLINQT